jgi:ABC-type lipoprotein release transport system permease subunit
MGAVASLLATRTLAQMIFGLKSDDPATFLGIASLFMLFALVSCVVPARRAMNIDPASTLRSD